MKDANFETETLYHVIECRDLQEKEAATTGDKKTMLQVIGGWYKDGFRFLESFELAKMHYGVFTKDVEVAMSTAPSQGKDAAMTAQEASESVFEDIMSELKDIARESLGWTDFENGTVPSDSLYGQFWKAIHIRLHYAPIHETTKGDGNQVEYLESIAKNIIQRREGQS